MKIVEIPIDDLVVSDDLVRSGSAKQFEERLRASIDEIGLAEPLKVAALPNGKYLVVDGTMRLRAISSLRIEQASRFATIPAYVTDYERRYEIRFQTDVYQDLLPSQLAALVEHLHKAERVKKVDIARFIGVSPATLRNYTGLWRLMERGGLFEKLVEMMDVGVIPSSNPFAWLRLNEAGLRKVLEDSFSEGKRAEDWIDECVMAARQAHGTRFLTEYVESTTDGLEASYYREDQELRSVKRKLGHRRGGGQSAKATPAWDSGAAVKHLRRVSRQSSEPVLQSAARSLQAYLK